MSSAAGQVQRIIEKFVSIIRAQCNTDAGEGKGLGETVVALYCIRTSAWLLRAFSADIFSHIFAGEDLYMHEKEPSMWYKAVEALVGASLIRVALPVPYWKFPGLENLDGRETAKSAVVEGGSPKTLVGKLKRFVKEGKTSADQMAADVAGLYLASHTLVPAMASAFFHLAQLPDLQMAIAMEMKESEEISGEGESIWAEALFLEALRFYPFEFRFFRTLGTITIAGQQVPEGTNIILHMRHILRHLKSPKLGDDLEDFRPGRWVGSDGIIDAGPINTLAFGYGSRQCIGRKLSMKLGVQMIQEVARTFSLESEPKEPTKRELTVDGFSNLPVVEDVHIRVRLRNAHPFPGANEESSASKKVTSFVDQSNLLNFV